MFPYQSSVTLAKLNEVKMEDQTEQPSSTPSSTLLPESPLVPRYDVVPQEVEKF